MIDRIGGRKVLIGAIVLALAIIVSAWLPNGLTETLADVLKFVAVGFFLGNGLEHGAKAMAKKKPAQVVDTSNLEKQIAAIAQQVALVNEQNAVTQNALSYIMDQTGLSKKRGSN